MGHRLGESARFAAVLLIAIASACACTMCSFAVAAQPRDEHSPALGKIKQADTAAIDCGDCPRGLAEAGKAANKALLDWKRFRLVEDSQKADVVFLFSANPYLGDYLTRKGPDVRPVKIDTTYMTVIDPRTGAVLWSDSREWGSWRVGSATRSLIDELRSEMEVEAKTWSVEDVFRCTGAPVYQAFAHATAEAALANPDFKVRRIEEAPDRLGVYSPRAPEFCRRAELVIGSGNRITGYEVAATESDVLDVADVLEHADRYDFTSGKDPRTQKVRFTAWTKDHKVQIQFEVQGQRMVLTRVEYAY